MITYLGIAVAILFLAFAIYGFGIVVRRPESPDESPSESCTLCRNRFPKEMLVERAVGDSRLYFFCSSCIQSLSEELTTKYSGKASTLA
jgi:hypothetical protein